ncbi:MAG: RNA polymerase factor sigma-54 [Alphaproteobacteria bacterium]
MALGPRLEISQTQHLSLTPQLRQAISLLQMTNVELTDHIAEEVEKNPLLELVEPEPLDGDPTPPPEAAPRSNIEPASLISSTVSLESSDSFDPFENIEDKKSLRDLLREQIHISERSPARAAIALVLIDELDEHGWLTAPMFEIADRLGIPQAAVEDALEALQACDPVGVGARNLQECLEIQLKEAGEFTPLMQVLTANLDVLGDNDLPRLEALADVSRDALGDAIAALRQLNPRPAAKFDTGIVQIAVPDVTVSPSAVGGWLVELNTEALPKALVNENYYSEVTKNGAEVSEFVAECRANARFLVKAMDQRAKTILRVSSVIVRHQNRFFDEGITGLRPLTLAVVATELDIHESTVSRVTKGKYLYCQRGTFELRFFFVQGIGRNDGGNDIAAPVVRERIRKLVTEEQLDKVLSDEKIAKILQEGGVDVARRTVAKYREAMGIPSSSRRRRKHI